jgi:uncharacterized protein YcfJ
MNVLSILIAGMLLLTGSVSAQVHPAPPAVHEEGAHYGWADVLRVDPVYDDSAPASGNAQDCYEQQVPAQGNSDNSGKRTVATVFGAIVGGILGHQIGKGDGRTAATAAGAVAGGVVGNNLAANADPAGPRYKVERHCPQGEGGPAASRRVVAYDVEYRYRGEVYTARINYDPGDRLRVRISVTPAE